MAKKSRDGQNERRWTNEAPLNWITRLMNEQVKRSWRGVSAVGGQLKRTDLAVLAKRQI